MPTYMYNCIKFYKLTVVLMVSIGKDFLNDRSQRCILFSDSLNILIVDHKLFITQIA